MLRSILNQINKRSAKISNGEFANRIRSRHNIFWSDPNAEIVRNTIMSANDPIEKWMDVENWQRKLSNKYNSREFAIKHGCRVADLYWKGRDIENIPFDQFPDHFVIRPTIGYSCGMVFLMSNGLNLMDQKSYSKDELLAEMKKGVDENPLLEFLVEEFVKTEQGEYKIPVDYKLYMFDGELASICVINRSGYKAGLLTNYNEHWHQTASDNTSYSTGPYQQPPNCLPDIIEQARILSKSYGIFARIDFYATDKGAVFGEFTPTPAKGNGFTPAADKLYTEYWNKYCPGKI